MRINHKIKIIPRTYFTNQLSSIKTIDMKKFEHEGMTIYSPKKHVHQFEPSLEPDDCGNFTEVCIIDDCVETRSLRD